MKFYCGELNNVAMLVVGGGRYRLVDERACFHYEKCCIVVENATARCVSKLSHDFVFLHFQKLHKMAPIFALKFGLESCRRLKMKGEKLYFFIPIFLNFLP